ncbi:MAG: hypothetical protein V1910_02020 [bacterium]
MKRKIISLMVIVGMVIVVILSPLLLFAKLVSVQIIFIVFGTGYLLILTGIVFGRKIKTEDIQRKRGLTFILVGTTLIVSSFVLSSIEIGFLWFLFLFILGYVITTYGMFKYTYLPKII